MTRQSKNTRIRGLPPRVQLQQKDAATGSFPSNVRIASDNRSGNYFVNYNDINTVDFLDSGVPSGASGPGHLGLEYQPLALYHLDGDLLDRSGNNFNLSLHSGSLQYTDGPFNGSQAFLFDGFNCVTSSIETSLQITGSMTMEAVFKPSVIETPDLPSFGNFIAAMVSAGETLQTNVLYSLIINGDVTLGSVGFFLERAAGSDFIATSTANAIVANTWYHLVVTRDDSSNSTIYLNGQNLGTFKHSKWPEKAGSGNTQKVHIGSTPTGGGNYQQLAFKGAVSNVKIIGRELTQDEVLAEFVKVFPKGGLLGGVGFPIGNKWIENRIGSDLPTSGGMALRGPVRSQIIEDQQFFHFTPGQDLMPFKENDNPALDGLSSTSSFYAEGSPVSLVGEGFAQPLWSKTKIQIPLPVVPGSSANTISTYISGGHNVTLNSDPASGSVDKGFGPFPTTGGFVNLSYPMAYYNFNTQRWEGVGRGEAYCYTGRFSTRNGSVDVAPFYSTMCAGFSQGLVSQREGILNPGISGAFEYIAGAGQPIANFGFPFDARYHATSSQLLKMSNYISEPFLVEKIVIDFSGSFQFNSENYTTGTIVPSVNTVISSAFPGAINNFFILVQRMPYSFKTSLGIESGPSFTTDIALNSTLPTRVTLSNAAGATFVNSIREVLTFGGVSSFAANTPTSVTRQGNVGGSLILNASLASKNPKQLMTRDVVFESTRSMVENLTPLNWSGSFRMEIGSRNPTRVFDLFGIIEYGNDPEIASMDTKFDFGGRSGLGVLFPSGRDLISPIVNVQAEAFATNGRTLKTVVLANPDLHYRFGGYILKPEDSLIIGWQQPIPMTLTVDFSSRHVNDGIFSSMTFNSANITLYGSLLREGKEYHDTLNQLLTSNTVHEVIE